MFADSGDCVVLEQRLAQRLAGWHSYFWVLHRECCRKTTRMSSNNKKAVEVKLLIQFLPVTEIFQESDFCGFEIFFWSRSLIQTNASSRFVHGDCSLDFSWYHWYSSVPTSHLLLTLSHRAVWVFLFFSIIYTICSHKEVCLDYSYHHNH